MHAISNKNSQKAKPRFFVGAVGCTLTLPKGAKLACALRSSSSQKSHFVAIFGSPVKILPCASENHAVSSELSVALSHCSFGAMLACALRSSSSQKSRAKPCDFRETLLIRATYYRNRVRSPLFIKPKGFGKLGALAKNVIFARARNYRKSSRVSRTKVLRLTKPILRSGCLQTFMQNRRS